MGRISDLTYTSTLRENCPRVFLVRFFPHSDWIRRDTEYLYRVFLRIQFKCGKRRTRKPSNTDTFHALQVQIIFREECFPKIFAQFIWKHHSSKYHACYWSIRLHFSWLTRRDIFQQPLVFWLLKAKKIRLLFPEMLLTRKIFTRASAIYFFNRLFGDIFFSSLVSFDFFGSCFCVVVCLLFFEIKNVYPDTHSTMRVAEW